VRARKQLSLHLRKLVKTRRQLKPFPDLYAVLQVSCYFCTGLFLFQYSFLTGSTSIDVAMLQTKTIIC